MSPHPRTAAELDRLDPARALLAGGTDLLVRRRAGHQSGPLADVSRLRDAPAPVRRLSDGSIWLSALAPLSVIDRELGGELPGLRAAIACFASGQIRNRATLGGNLANASPAADGVPPLVAAGAVLRLRGPAGRREIPVAEFATGPGRTRLAPGEWIETIDLAPQPAHAGFRKIAGRRALAISVVSLAWTWGRDPGGALTGVRLAAGAVAPTVVRCPGAEAALEGRVPTPEAVAAAVAALDHDISPISDLRASAGYRRAALAGALTEALTPALTEAPARRNT
ncbi:xanthine dehydrogenase family protein subunit M [Spongiactinospora rosea]|uniref:Xanthine dehydrogenase family protein subunit M n=1 Tax=Spongiactinospora rosea TaxID=2248750 RepID=A0A366LZL4_9ACTN|nr:FAD binding domain-containing protein [Spongiactinospora rosea]RBQ19207.1 xanthine dehydrogenase family protein subunit M [Spongiactinospora rosea]